MSLWLVFGVFGLCQKWKYGGVLTGVAFKHRLRRAIMPRGSYWHQPGWKDFRTERSERSGKLDVQDQDKGELCEPHSVYRSQNAKCPGIMVWTGE